MYVTHFLIQFLYICEISTEIHMRARRDMLLSSYYEHEHMLHIILLYIYYLLHYTYVPFKHKNIDALDFSSINQTKYGHIINRII